MLIYAGVATDAGDNIQGIHPGLTSRQAAELLQSIAADWLVKLEEGHEGE